MEQHLNSSDIMAVQPELRCFQVHHGKREMSIFELCNSYNQVRFSGLLGFGCTFLSLQALLMRGSLHVRLFG